MSPNLSAIQDRVSEKVAQYLEELGPQLMEHRQQGRVVRFSFSATIDDEAITYAASLGVKGIKALKTSDRLDDPNQSTLGV